MTRTLDPPRRPPARPGADRRVPVDPRIVRRRHEVRVEAGRRRRRRLLAAFVAAVVVMAAAGVLASPLLDVDRVRVSGQELPAGLGASVREASRIGVGDQLVGLDLAAARRRVMALPMVASARVSVDWPDAVDIRVTAQRPLLVLQGPAAEWVVARGGRVLGGPDAVTGAAGLPRLVVEADPPVAAGRAVPSVVRDALVVFEQMPASLAGRLGVARLDGEGALTFEVADGGTVRFGPAEDVPAKLVAVETGLGGRIVLDCLDVLDVRDPTRLTVSRRDGCSVPSAGGDR